MAYIVKTKLLELLNKHWFDETLTLSDEKEEMLYLCIKYSNEKFNRIWEIYCDENDIDYEDVYYGDIFDELIDEIKEGKTFTIVELEALLEKN
jgi:hypothetical protein